MNIIAAMTKDRVIGKDNKIPWHISEDLKLFKRLTMGSIIIMGRKTFESLNKRPLPGRTNAVISRTIKDIPGFVFFSNLEKAVAWTKEQEQEVFFIGGAEIYKQALALADQLYLSYVNEEYEGDTFFPEFDKNDWHIEKEEVYEAFSLKVFKHR